MSRRKVNGAWIDEGPGAAGAVDGLGAIGRLTGLSIPEAPSGAGPIERRQVAEAQRAAWRQEAIEAAGNDMPLIATVLAAAAPAPEADEEELDMDDPERPAAGDPLTRLAAAATEAAEARDAFEAARLRRNASVEALRAAWDDLGLKRVLEVLERHAGDTKAAGLELGMRGNVVARIAQSARARAAASA